MTTGPSQVDRLDGVNEGIGKKAPVRVRTIGNVTLAGLGTTHDSVTLVEGDRVLVMAQSDQTENGIYNASSGNWTRALDANGNRDLVKGSMVFVNEGTTYQQTMWQCTTANPITIGEDNIVFVQWSGGGGFPNEPYVVIGDGSDGTLPNNRQLAAGTGITLTDGGAASTATLAVAANVRTASILYEIDGGGSVITTGIKAPGIYIPFACTITAVRLLGDQFGSIVVDIWADTYANYPPTNADSICASAKPTISAATKSEDTTLTGWTTSIAAGTVLRLNVDSISTLTKCDVNITVVKT